MNQREKATILNATLSNGKTSSRTQQGGVFQEIASALLSGEFAPGQAISVQMLCQKFQSSTMPVRDSVARLVGLGALVSSPNRMLRIPHFTLSEFEELCTARALLESELAVRAASRCSANTAQRLRDEIAELHQSLDIGAINDTLGHNVRLHFLVYTESKSRHVLPFVEALWLRMGPLLRVPFTAASAELSEFLQAGTLHELLAVAIEQRDAIAAGHVMHSIIDSTRRWYLKHYVFADPDGIPVRHGPQHLLPEVMTP
jgi:DNA-binding GntR family transcriptional regulator